MLRAESNFKKDINQSSFLKRDRQKLFVESCKRSRLVKLRKITDSKFGYLRQVNRGIPISTYILVS
jgi:hypothetical protein